MPTTLVSSFDILSATASAVAFRISFSGDAAVGLDVSATGRYGVVGEIGRRGA